MKKKQYKPKKYYPEVAKGAGAAKGERIICDENVKPGTVHVSIMPFLPSDNQFIMQLYDNPDSKVLKASGLKMEREHFMGVLHQISVKLLYVRSLHFSEFWCAMLDKDMKEFLDSFPLNFDPFVLEYIGRKNYNDVLSSLSETLTSILKSVLLIYHRISNRTEFLKEEKATYEISQRCYGKVVFDGFLVDTAKLLDLCAIYAASNGTLLSSIILSIFENEPRYYDDLLEAVKILQAEFNKLTKETEIAINKPRDTSDLSCQRLLIRMYDITKHVGNIARCFPIEGVDELFKTKAYLWLPIIRELAKTIVLQMIDKKPFTVRISNEIMNSTVDSGAVLANVGILLRGTYVNAWQKEIASRTGKYVMEMSQNDKIEDPVLSNSLKSVKLTAYFKKILRNVDIVDFIKSQKESIIPPDRKHMLTTILLSIGTIEAPIVPPKPETAAVPKGYESTISQLIEIFPNMDAEIIKATVNEVNGDLEKAAAALSEMAKGVPEKAEKAEEAPLMEQVKGKPAPVEKPEEEKMPEDLLPLLRGDSDMREYQEEQMHALRQKEIEEEHMKVQAEKEDEMLELHEAAIRKTKELAAKYMYDDDEDELPVLVNQESTNIKSDDLENEEEEERQKSREKQKEVKKEMTQSEKEHAKKMNKVEKAKRKYNKSKKGGKKEFRKKA